MLGGDMRTNRVGCLDYAGRECRTDSQIHAGLVLDHAQPPSQPISRLLRQLTRRISLRAQEEEKEERMEQCCCVAAVVNMEVGTDCIVACKAYLQCFRHNLRQQLTEELQQLRGLLFTASRQLLLSAPWLPCSIPAQSTRPEPDLKEIKLTPRLKGGAFSLLTMKCTSAIVPR